MSSSLNYKLAAFLIVLGALSGIVVLSAFYLRNFKPDEALAGAHTPLGQGTRNEPFRTDNGNFCDPAWWNESYAPISRLHLMVRLGYQLFEVLLPGSRSCPERAEGVIYALESSMSF